MRQGIAPHPGGVPALHVILRSRDRRAARREVDHVHAVAHGIVQGFDNDALGWTVADTRTSINFVGAQVSLGSHAAKCHRAGAVLNRGRHRGYRRTVAVAVARREIVGQASGCGRGRIGAGSYHGYVAARHNHFVIGEPAAVARCPGNRRIALGETGWRGKAGIVKSRVGMHATGVDPRVEDADLDPIAGITLAADGSLCPGSRRIRQCGGLVQAWLDDALRHHADNARHAPQFRHAVGSGHHKDGVHHHGSRSGNLNLTARQILNDRLLPGLNSLAIVDGRGGLQLLVCRKVRRHRLVLQK